MNGLSWLGNDPVTISGRNCLDSGRRKGWDERCGFPSWSTATPRDLKVEWDRWGSEEKQCSRQDQSVGASSTMLVAVDVLGRACRAIEGCNVMVFVCPLRATHGLDLRDYVLGLVCGCIRNSDSPSFWWAFQTICPASSPSLGPPDEYLCAISHWPLVISANILRSAY